jgi:hypothetical protein
MKDQGLIYEVGLRTIYSICKSRGASRTELATALTIIFVICKELVPNINDDDLSEDQPPALTTIKPTTGAAANASAYWSPYVKPTEH